VSLITSILGGEFPKDQVAYSTEDLDRLDKTYGGARSTFLVAERGGKIVGTCGVKAEDETTAILRRFFVDSTLRGHGMGSGLLKEALAFCRSKGFAQVVIRTSTRMEQAIRLCLSQGFVEDGRWTLGGVTLVRFRLGLQ